MDSSRSRSVAALALVLMLPTAGGAAETSAMDAAATELSGVIVIATRREEKLNNDQFYIRGQFSVKF